MADITHNNGMEPVVNLNTHRFESHVTISESGPEETYTANNCPIVSESFVSHRTSFSHRSDIKLACYCGCVDRTTGLTMQYSTN
jgi:hypothetical protein